MAVPRGRLDGKSLVDVLSLSLSLLGCSGVRLMGADTPDPNWTYRIPRGGWYQYTGTSVGIPYASVDDDLEFVVFMTMADILGIGTPANVFQVYRWERRTDETLLVSRDWRGRPSPSSCYRPTVSNGGRWVVFDTTAALVEDDTNGTWDAYARILDEVFDEPFTVRLSVSANGEQGNSWSAYACVAEVDRMGLDIACGGVAFTSAASNLVPSDQNGQPDVFYVWAVVNPEWSPPLEMPDGVALVSVNNQGQQSNTTTIRTPAYGSRSPRFVWNRGSQWPWVWDVLFVGAPCDWTDPCVEERNGELVFLNCLCPDPDGECVEDCQGVRQVYYRDGFNSHTYRASRTWVENQGFFPGNAPSEAACLGQGVVAWSSTATNFPGDTDPYSDVFAIKAGVDGSGLDSSNWVPVRMSQPLGTSSNGHSRFASTTFYFVAFESAASNLVQGDTNGTQDVFVAYRMDRTVGRFSVASDGTQANGYSYLAGLVEKTAYVNGDGGDLAVVFTSAASNLVPGDTNGRRDIFVSLSRRFVRGDADDDGSVDAEDRTLVLEYLFQSGPPPPCMVAADRNDDGAISISDAVPCSGCEPSETCCVPPPNACGLNFTPDSLTCEYYTSC